MLRIFVTTLLAILVVATAAVAQTTAPAPNPNQGAFTKLSPDDQKIAQALFEAQKVGATPGTTKALTLDDIAAMKESGKGWGVIFQEMKGKGLVQEKNLGEVVSKYSHQQRTPSTSGKGSKGDDGQKGGSGAAVSRERGNDPSSGRGAAGSGGHGGGRGK